MNIRASGCHLRKETPRDSVRIQKLGDFPTLVIKLAIRPETQCTLSSYLRKRHLGEGAPLPARPGGGALGREQTWAASKEGSKQVGSRAC